MIQMELLQKKVWLVVSSFCVLDQNIGQSENGEQLEYFCDLRIKIFPFRFHAFSLQGLLDDSLAVYHWILANTEGSPIYTWGHSLGSAYVPEY